MVFVKYKVFLNWEEMDYEVPNQTKVEKELIKLIETHSIEHNYIERLKYEMKLVEVIDLVRISIKKQSMSFEICQEYIEKLGLLCYGNNFSAVKQNKDELQALEAWISDRSRTNAILLYVYKHTFYENKFMKRDMELMSYVQKSISFFDLPMQVFYYQTLAYLSFSAFQSAFMSESHKCLYDLITGVTRELFTLSFVLKPKKKIKQAESGTDLGLLLHSHISEDMIECIFLVSAMFLEVPYLASNNPEAKSLGLTQIFYQKLKRIEKQNFCGPPETVQEFVLAASRAMRTGNWPKCAGFIVNEKMNEKVWNMFYKADEIRALLFKLIKVECLRTHLLKYLTNYSSLSVKQLADMFKLGESDTYYIISQMHCNHELEGTWDKSEELVLHLENRVNVPSRTTQKYFGPMAGILLKNGVEVK